MTTVAEIKSALHQHIANTEDEKILHKMQVYFQSLIKNDKKIVAYDSKLRPLTVKQYKASIEESIGQYKKKRVVSQKEMEKRL